MTREEGEENAARDVAEKIGVDPCMLCRKEVSEVGGVVVMEGNDLLPYRQFLPPHVTILVGGYVICWDCFAKDELSELMWKLKKVFLARYEALKEQLQKSLLPAAETPRATSIETSKEEVPVGTVRH